MIKGKFKKAVSRRDSENSTFRSPPLPTMSSAPYPLDQGFPSADSTPNLSRPRTRDDESIYMNTARIKGDDNISIDHAGAVPKSFYKTSGQSTSKGEEDTVNFVDEFIDRMNMGKIGKFLKTVMISIIQRVLRSNYISTDNNGKIHIQSFGLGVAMTSIVVMIQPFLVVYLDSWVLLLGRLFKHIIAWVVVAAVLSYMLNPKGRKGKAKEELDSLSDERMNHFKELQYSVKTSQNNSRSTSPSKSMKSMSPRAPLGFTKNSRPLAVQRRESEPLRISANRRDSYASSYNQLGLMSATDELFDDLDRRDQLERPVTNYDKFMDTAHKKENEQQKYSKFVNDNRDTLLNRKINTPTTATFDYA